MRMPKMNGGAAGTVMGNMTQVHVPANITDDPSRATMTTYQPQMQAMQEQAAPLYIAGPGSEEVAQAQATVQKYKQVVAGQTTQQAVVAHRQSGSDRPRGSTSSCAGQGGCRSGARDAPTGKDTSGIY